MGKAHPFWASGIAIVLAGGCGRIGFATVDGDGGDASTSFCASLAVQPTRCADFDHGLPIETGFDQRFVENTGVIDLGTLASSPPGSLYATYGVQTASTDHSRAAVRWLLPGTLSRLELSFAFLLPARPTTGSFELNDLVIDVPGVGSFYNDIEVLSGGADRYLEELNPTTGTFMAHPTAIPTLSIGTWHQVHWILDLSGRTFSLEIDGANAASGATFFANLAPGTVTVEIGVDFASGVTSGGSVYVDSVVLSAI